MSAILDELIVLREAALSEDERVRREVPSGTIVEIGVQCPLAKIDEMIYALEEGERRATACESLTAAEQHLIAAHRKLMSARWWGFVSLALCGISLAMTFGRLVLEGIR